MLVEERRKQVLNHVEERGFITLADLAREMSVSESTIRRDLGYWERQGALKRIHGGAMSSGNGTTLPALEARLNRSVAEKRRVAREAARRIHDGDSILLDGGTTTLELARLLVGRPLHIITNSLPIANLFANSQETDLVFVGGCIFPRTGVALGPFTTRILEEVHVHQAILSVGGITAKGLFNSNLLLVETERQMMRCADEVVVIADHTKVGRQALAFLCKLSAVDTLIVDQGLAPEHRSWLAESGVQLLIAGKASANANTRRRRA
jgi:DeoR family transcriptional regulator, fructose operon transcriptional repressor